MSEPEATQAADIIAIADGIVAALNDEDADWSQPFTAVRTYRPVHDRKLLSELKCSVVPATARSTRTTRAATQHDYEVHVGFQQAVATDEEADALVALASEVADALRDLNIALDEAQTRIAACTEIQHDPVFAPAHMQESNVCTTVLRLTYTLAR